MGNYPFLELCGRLFDGEWYLSEFHYSGIASRLVCGENGEKLKADIVIKDRFSPAMFKPEKGLISVVVYKKINRPVKIEICKLLGSERKMIRNTCRDVHYFNSEPIYDYEYKDCEVEKEHGGQFYKIIRESLPEGIPEQFKAVVTETIHQYNLGFDCELEKFKPYCTNA